MDTDTREYGMGTKLVATYPFGFYRGGYALCSDGKVRKLKRISETADTFFSVPAAVVVKGKTVAGFIMFETMQGFSTETENDPAVVKFRAFQNRKNANLLPEGVYRTNIAESYIMVASATGRIVHSNCSAGPGCMHCGNGSAGRSCQ